MSVDERARHELFNKFDEVIGSGPTETLMALLPPVGWADVATKADLFALEERIELRFEKQEARFEARLLDAINAQTKTLFFSLFAANATLTTAVIAAIKF